MENCGQDVRNLLNLQKNRIMGCEALTAVKLAPVKLGYYHGKGGNGLFYYYREGRNN